MVGGGGWGGVGFAKQFLSQTQPMLNCRWIELGLWQYTLTFLFQNDLFSSSWSDFLLPNDPSGRKYFLAVLPWLMPNTSYSVMVKARNRMGWSKLSQEIVFNTTNNSNNAIIVVILLLFALFSGFTNNIIGDSSNVAHFRPEDLKVLIFLLVLLKICELYFSW